MMKDARDSMNWLQKTSGIHPILSGLAAEARKYGSFEEFRRSFLTELKHGMYWHVTDDPNFIIDPEKGPRDRSSLSTTDQIDPGKLMITSHLEYWASNYAPARKYAALIDMSNVDKSSYAQVNRGMGNEFFVHNPGNATVAGVFGISDALRIDAEHRNKLPGSEEQLQEFFNKAHSSDSAGLGKDELLSYYDHHTPESWQGEWDEDWSSLWEEGL